MPLILMASFQLFLLHFFRSFERVRRNWFILRFERKTNFFLSSHKNLIKTSLWFFLTRWLGAREG